MVNSKKFDPFVPPYPYWHITELCNLRGILEKGLISPNLAKKLKKTNYKRTFSSSWNEDYVSLMSRQTSRKATAPGIAILVNRKIKTIPAQGRYVKDDKNRPVPYELLVKDRILPEDFLGLVIGEVGWSFKLEKPIKPRPLSVKRVVSVLSRVKSRSALPVYFKGKLVWPRKAGAGQNQ